MNFTKLSGIAEQPAKADKSALIRIHLTQSSSTSVGAREVRSGGEGLDGRQRPVPCADMEGERAHTPSTGRPSRPSLPHIIHSRCMRYHHRDLSCLLTS